MMIEIHNSGLWFSALASISTGLILAHNLWLVATSERDLNDLPLNIEVNTGHRFPVSTSAVNPARVAELRLVTSTRSQPITNYTVEGQSLVARVESPGDSSSRTLLVALTLHPHSITLETEKFSGYIDDEDAHNAVAHARFQETGVPQREIYTKYAKAILGASTDEGDDTYREVVGHKLEIIPGLNPATLRREANLPVQVLFDRRPLKGVRVSSGCEQLNSGSYAAHVRTDQEGKAVVQLSAAGRWFVRTHYIKPHPDLQIGDWESFWSSLTFEVET